MKNLCSYCVYGYVVDLVGMSCGRCLNDGADCSRCDGTGWEERYEWFPCQMCRQAHLYNRSYFEPHDDAYNISQEEMELLYQTLPEQRREPMDEVHYELVVYFKYLNLTRRFHLEPLAAMYATWRANRIFIAEDFASSLDTDWKETYRMVMEGDPHEIAEFISYINRRPYRELFLYMKDKEKFMITDGVKGAIEITLFDVHLSGEVKTTLMPDSTVIEVDYEEDDPDVQEYDDNEDEYRLPNYF